MQLCDKRGQGVANKRRRQPQDRTSWGCRRLGGRTQEKTPEQSRSGGLVQVKGVPEPSRQRACKRIPPPVPSRTAMRTDPRMIFVLLHDIPCVTLKALGLSVLMMAADKSDQERIVLSLFTGAGGLDLGLEHAGFDIRLCVEVDDDARATIEANRPHWRFAEPNDIHDIRPENLVQQAIFGREHIALLAGGPPCQPFSKSAYWADSGSKGLRDPRAATLYAFLKVAQEALPRVILLENVTGLVFNGKNHGLELLRDGLHAINRRRGTKYDLQVIQINSADYGVPQFRERIFVIASVDGRKLSMPPPTHGSVQGLKPFCTAWDAIGHLDMDAWLEELEPKGKWAALLPSIPEGHNYLWHSSRGGGEPLFGWRTRYWSFLLKLAKNRPSWTIQATPGPATGPFHWRSRLLSIEELSALQTFPTGYNVKGSRTSAHRQLGNAVPCAIAELLGLEIRRQLLDQRVRRQLRLIPQHRDDCPAPQSPRPTPRRYLAFKGVHPDHPGVGNGPGARERLTVRTGVQSPR